MHITRHSDTIVGTSTQRSAITTHIDEGTFFAETDNEDFYQRIGGTWLPIGGGGGVSTFLALTDVSIPSFTDGSVLFTSGTEVTEDNANFHWDDTNDRFGLGTASPTYPLDLQLSTDQKYGTNLAPTLTSPVLNSFGVAIAPTIEPNVTTGGGTVGGLSVVTTLDNSSEDQEAHGSYFQVASTSGYSGSEDVHTIHIAEASYVGGTVETQFGIYIDALTAGFDNYSLFTNTGEVSLGDSLEFRQASSVYTSVGDLSISSATGIININNALFLNEVAAAYADVPNYGQIWVKNTTPNELWFTDDAGTDFQLGTGSTDTTAIHDNIASEISAITEKTTPVSADLLLIEDSADSNNKKRLQIGNLPVGAHDIVGSSHTVTASAFDLVGATTTNTIGLITPASDPAGANEVVLKTNTSGNINLQSGLTFNVAATVSTSAGDLTLSPFTGIVNVNDVLLLNEVAAAYTDVPNYGQIWVKNNTPNELWFTDDAGTDFQLGTGSTDATAIHDNIASEISAITEKTTPVSADLLLIEDSADSNNKKRVQIGNLPGSATTFLALTDVGITSFTAGSVLFTSGSEVTEDTTNFVWDDINKRFGIGTATPAYSLDVSGSSRISGTLGVGRTPIANYGISTNHNSGDYSATTIGFNPAVNATSANSIYGALAIASVNRGATIHSNIAYGLVGRAQTASSQTANVTGTLVGLQGEVYHRGSGVMSTARAVVVTNPNNLGSGSIANKYGMYIANITGGTSSNYAIYTGIGDISLGDNITFRQASTISASTGQLTIDAAGGIVINEDGDDEDFRIEGSGNVNLFYLDAGSDFVGIGTAPSYRFHVSDTTTANTAQEHATYSYFSVEPTTASIHGYEAIRGYAESNATVSVGAVIGGVFYADLGSSGNVTNLRGLEVYATVTGSGTALTGTGIKIDLFDTGAGGMTNAIGLDIANITEGSSANTAIRTAGGTINFSAGGVVVGVPTGGDKGTGTINVATDIYKNNSAYTNPDYALEMWATGDIQTHANKPGARGYRRRELVEIEQHIRENFRLPHIGDEAWGIFKRSDTVLELVEELFTHGIEAYHQRRDLENRIIALEEQIHEN